jgi:hypothetical protein
MGNLPQRRRGAEIGKYSASQRLCGRFRKSVLISSGVSVGSVPYLSFEWSSSSRLDLAILEAEDPETAEVVRLRYFVGMTIPETAAALEIAPRTVNRHWTFARAWLKKTVRESLAGSQ